MDTEIVDAERKGGIALGVLPEAGGALHVILSIRG